MRLLDGRSKLTMHNKLLIYKTIIQPTWAYGLELWGSTKRTNLNRILSLQSKTLRKIVDAPFYVTNLTIHKDLKVPIVHDLVRSRYKKFHESTIHHSNPLVLYLSSNTLPLNPTRRHKRRWWRPRDQLVQWKVNKLMWWVVPLCSLLNIGPSDSSRTLSHITITIIKLI
jgi:hypothetical protein